MHVRCKMEHSVLLYSRSIVLVCQENLLLLYGQPTFFLNIRASSGARSRFTSRCLRYIIASVAIRVDYNPFPKFPPPPKSRARRHVV